MLEDVFTSAYTGSVGLADMLLCTGASLLLGLGVALIYMYRHHYNRNFVLTLALLPATVQAVIMLVNGNLGTGVAVMGAFSLVRFRSVPGSAREIGSIFLAMAVGLACATGYLLYALLLLLAIGAATVLLTLCRFGSQSPTARNLRISIPESLNYTGLFDDLFASYTRSAQLLRVRTTNMGSLFELYYAIELKDPAAEKQLIDQLRCRNGNLAITCSLAGNSGEEL